MQNLRVKLLPYHLHQVSFLVVPFILCLDVNLCSLLLLLGYRLNEDFFNSVKNECSALMTNKLDDVTQSARWIPIQTFLDVHLKPYIILAK